MTTIILSPGYDNSCENHWQSHLEQKYQNIIRVQQDNWQNPVRKTWIGALAKTIESVEGNVLLVGHSCGCNAITQWSEQNTLQNTVQSIEQRTEQATINQDKVIGAILVAPADVDAENSIEPIKVQRPVSLKSLPFSSTLICSDNDPHAELERSQYFAGKWGSELIILKEAGHINAGSGYNDWPLIKELIETKIGQSLTLK